MSHNLRIYTDGGCWNGSEEGNGSWAFVVTENGQEIFSKVGMVLGTTNNQMELQAIIEALVWLDHPCEEVLIISDSKYCVTGITSWVHGWIAKGWKTSGNQVVKNQPQWKVLHSLTYYGNQPNLEFKWVKGHSGNKFNDMADELCTEALKSFNAMDTSSKKFKARDFLLPDYAHLIKKPPAVKMMQWAQNKT